MVPQPARVKGGHFFRDDGRELVCPFGLPGDLLWVRERFLFTEGRDGPVMYAADEPKRMRFQQSQFMPRSASRYLLEIISTRGQRLREISEADARAEGYDPRWTEPPAKWFQQLWDGLSPGDGLMWGDNPWVWVVEFRVAGGVSHEAGAALRSGRGVRNATDDEKRRLVEALRTPPLTGNADSLARYSGRGRG